MLRVTRASWAVPAPVWFLPEIQGAAKATQSVVQPVARWTHLFRRQGSPGRGLAANGGPPVS
jgi:hypothetical protein